MKKIIVILLIFSFICSMVTPAKTEIVRWNSVDYINNFILTYIPTSEAIGRMGVKGFFTLWGILSFLETHLPSGLDGKKYVVAIRDLKTSIAFYKKDMIYLVKEIFGVRKIDRDVLKVQILDISQQLQVIVRTIQNVRMALLKTAYYLFSATINKKILQSKNYKFSVSLNYLSTDNPWRGWLIRKNLYRQIDVAEELQVDVVKLNLFLDYWVYNRPKVRRDFKNTVEMLKKRGFKIFLASEGINSYFKLDLSFADRKGIPNGMVNWITWKHQAAKGIYFLLKTFKPEYMTIIKDPFINLQEQVNQKVTIDQWIDFVKTVAQNGEKLSPESKLVLEIPLNTDRESLFLQKVLELKNKNIVIGFMIYSVKDIFSIGQFISSNKIKKELIIAELWDGVGLYIDSLAEEFMKLSYLWSLDKKIDLFNISFAVNLHTPHFKKTPAYYVYKNIITRSAVITHSKEGIKADVDGFHGKLKWRGGEIPLKVIKPLIR